MGKSKKRGFNKIRNEDFIRLTRENAAAEAAKLLNQLDKEAYNLITLFGLTAEELLEEGANYEAVSNIKNILG